MNTEKQAERKSTVMADLFGDWQDICRNRHQGSPESSQAFETKVKPFLSESRAKVLAAINSSGGCGVTCKELAEAWGVGMNTVSGRFSELKKANLITPAGPARNGSKPYKENK